jgi:hypothetical protein
MATDANPLLGNGFCFFVVRKPLPAKNVSKRHAESIKD